LIQQRSSPMLSGMPAVLVNGSDAPVGQLLVCDRGALVRLSGQPQRVDDTVQRLAQPDPSLLLPTAGLAQQRTRRD
jgi:hypothetical protein